MGTSADPSRPADRSECFPVGEGVELHALRWDGGGEPPFVLVHGLASNAHLWDGVASELAGAGHPVVAVDLRGHGRSSKPDGGPGGGYDMATVAGDLRVVIESLAAESAGAGRPVVVGQSWGANVVVEMAARFPGLARAIGCIDGGAIELACDFPDWETCAASLRPPSLAGTERGEIEEMLRRSHPDWPESGIAGTMASFEVRGDGTVAPWLTIERHLLVLRGLWEHRPSERIPLIEAPILFVVAEDSDAGPGALAAARMRRLEELAAAGRDVRIRSMVGDHDLHAQHPVRVAALLRTLAG